MSESNYPTEKRTMIGYETVQADYKTNTNSNQIPGIFSNAMTQGGVYSQTIVKNENDTTINGNVPDGSTPG